jgi:hypothetical protein
LPGRRTHSLVTILAMLFWLAVMIEICFHVAGSNVHVSTW